MPCPLPVLLTPGHPVLCSSTLRGLLSNLPIRSRPCHARSLPTRRGRSWLLVLIHRDLGNEEHSPSRARQVPPRLAINPEHCLAERGQTVNSFRSERPAAEPAHAQLSTHVGHKENSSRPSAMPTRTQTSLPRGRINARPGPLIPRDPLGLLGFKPFLTTRQLSGESTSLMAGTWPALV